MIAVMLLMFVGGIALSQAVSDPKQVTLRWLRLGGIISLTLLALTIVITVLTHERTGDNFLLFAVLSTISVILQLMCAQLNRRIEQRWAAICAFGCACILAGIQMSVPINWSLDISLGRLPSAFRDGPGWLFKMGFILFDDAPNVTAFASAGLLGGFLMAMLLGHAYLTAGNEMTQAPFRRLVLMLAWLLLARAALSLLFGLWPYLHAADVRSADRMWNTIMITARYLVGLVVPAIFTYMTYDCVKRRANQSATGILYVAAVLVIVGEGAALALLGATGLVF